MGGRKREIQIILQRPEKCNVTFFLHIFKMRIATLFLTVLFALVAAVHAKSADDVVNSTSQTLARRGG